MDPREDWEAGEPETAGAPPQQLSQLCLWSMILGISSLVCCGFFTAIPAVIMGHMGLSAVGDERGHLKGRGFALAGLILGYITLILTVMGILIMVMTGGLDELMRELEREL